MTTQPPGLNYSIDTEPSTARLWLMADLARDMYAFGSADKAGVLQSYNLSEKEFEDIARSQAYRLAMDNLEAMVKVDSNALLRLLSQAGLMRALASVMSISADSQAPAADRLKAVELLAKMADVMPKDKPPQGVPGLPGSGGPTLHLTVGASPPPAPAQPIVELPTGVIVGSVV